MNKNGTPRWQKGTAPYAEWLKTLTPEEYQNHLLERKQKKSMRKAMQEVIEANQEHWIAVLNNAAVKIMNNALETGDVQSFIAIYDRFIGKPNEVKSADENTVPHYEVVSMSKDSTP